MDQRLVTVTERRRKKERGKKRSIFRRYSLQCWNMLGAHRCRHARRTRILNTHTHKHRNTQEHLPSLK